MSLPENPETRREQYLSVIAGQNTTDILPDKPLTREELYYDVIARAISGIEKNAIPDNAISGITPTLLNAADARLQGLKVYGRTTEGASVGDNGLTITSVSPIGADSLRVSAEVTNVERTSSTKLKFTVTFNFPTGTTPIRCGLVATSNNVMTDTSDIYNNLTLYGDKVQYVKNSNTLPEADTDFNYGWTKSSVKTTDIWYVRPFAVYSTNDGVYVKYGHIDVSTTTTDKTLSDSNGECTELLLPISTGLPLRSADENTYDELDLAKGIVITRCEVVEGEVVPLDTPTVTELSETELAAWRKFRTFEGNTIVSVTDNPNITASYLQNTINGNALATIQDDTDKQLDEIREILAG